MNTPKLPPLPEPTWPFGCRYNEKDMQAYAIAAIEAQGVPDGWQLVPKEPTEKMCAADFDCDDSIGIDSARICYKAMLASAPPAPQTNNPKEQS